MREGKGKSLVNFPEDFCIIDIETTGLDYSCSIIELAAIKVRNGSILDFFSELVKPDTYYLDEFGHTVYIDSYITSLTGITNETLSSARTLEEVLPHFRDFIGSDILVGHNIVAFDSNFLYDAYDKILDKTFVNDLVDTMRLSRWLIPELDHHRLVDLAQFFSLDTSSMHRSLKDCTLTLQSFFALQEIASQKYGAPDKFTQYVNDRIHHRKCSRRNQISLRAKDIEAETTDFDVSNPIYGSVCVFTGTLNKMTRREAMQIVKNLGGDNGDNVTRNTNFLIMGNNEFCKSIKDGKSNKQKKAEKLKAEGVDIDIISESVFYDMISEDDPPSSSDTNNTSFFDGIAYVLKKFCDTNRLTPDIFSIKESYGKTGKISSYSLVVNEESYPPHLPGGNRNIVVMTFKLKNTIFSLSKDSRISYDFSDPELYSFVESSLESFFEDYPVANTFGCCSRMDECSSYKRCIHPNLLYAKGCLYRKRLESDQVFL